MRIELIQDIASSPALKASQSPLSLGQGEVIRATVVSVQGENVSLKTEDGRVFSARLQPGTFLMEHDTVELMAGGKRDQPVLRVVFVEPGQSGIPARESAGVKVQAVLTQQLREAFEQMNLRPTPKLISLAAEILKNYPADAKMAAFFAANNIPATPESIRAFQTVLEGKQFGAAFYEVVQDAAAALGLADTNADTSAEPVRTPQMQSQPDSAAQPNTANPSPAAPEGQSAVPRAVQIETNGGSAAQGRQTQVLPEQRDAALPQAQTQIPAVTGQEQGDAASKAQGQNPAPPRAEGIAPPQDAAVTGQEKPVLAMEEDMAAATGKEQIQPRAGGKEPPRDASAAGKPAPALQGEPAANQANSKEQLQPQQAASHVAAEQPQQQPVAGQPNAQQPQEKGVLTEKGIIQPGAEQTGALPQSAEKGATAAAYGSVPQDENAEQAPGFAPKEPAVFPHAAKSEEKAVLKQLLDLFAKAGEDLDAQTLKKSVEETPQKLLELQKLIKNTDIHTQEALASRFSELTAQAKLAEDISRFVFVQIPIHLKEYGSAELYIYKRNRREKGAERQSTSVVLGLSTQNLGRVEAMLRIENREISLDIRVQNEDAQNSFREGMAELQRSFSELRFQLKEYKVAPLKEPTTPLNAEEKLVWMHAPSGAGVDVII